MRELKVNINLFILARESKIWRFHRIFLNGENWHCCCLYKAIQSRCSCVHPGRNQSSYMVHTLPKLPAWSPQAPKCWFPFRLLWTADLGRGSEQGQANFFPVVWPLAKHLTICCLTEQTRHPDTYILPSALLHTSSMTLICPLWALSPNMPGPAPRAAQVQRSLRTCTQHLRGSAIPAAWTSLPCSPRPFGTWTRSGYGRDSAATWGGKHGGWSAWWHWMQRKWGSRESQASFQARAAPHPILAPAVFQNPEWNEHADSHFPAHPLIQCIWQPSPKFNRFRGGVGDPMQLPRWLSGKESAC